MARESKSRRTHSTRRKPARQEHTDGTTDRPETPALEGIDPVAEEITGRASRAHESLTTLFDQTENDHMVDGFRGGSGDVPEGKVPEER